MAIVSSSHATGHAQRDGRRYVREEHTDHRGAVHVFEYLWDGVANRDAILAARAGRITEALAAAEYAARIAVDGWDGALQHQSPGEFADKLRADYRISARERTCYLAWWIIRRIAEGSFTDNQVRNAFGMTVQDYTTFKTTKLQPAHDRWAGVVASAGE